MRRVLPLLLVPFSWILLAGRLSKTPEGFNTYRGTVGLNDPTPGIFNFARDGHPHDNLFEDNRVTNTKLGVKFKDCEAIAVSGECVLRSFVDKSNVRAPSSRASSMVSPSSFGYNSQAAMASHFRNSVCS